MKRLFLALVVAAAASPALATDSIPAAFHGDWCSIAGKDDLYRRGRCPKGVHGIHITADGYSDETGNCQVTGLLEARQAFLVDFDCRTKDGDFGNQANQHVDAHGHRRSAQYVDRRRHGSREPLTTGASRAGLVRPAGAGTRWAAGC